MEIYSENQYRSFMKGTSEEKLGLKLPYDYQCGAIDNMIEVSKESVSFCESALSALDQQTIVQANKEVLLRISNFEEQLEEFRLAMEETRLWGKEWKSAAKRLIDKYEPELLNPSFKDPDIPF